MCIICLRYLQAMFNIEMDLSSYFTCFHVLELLLFIAIYLSYILFYLELKYLIYLNMLKACHLFL
jgi:hypothetical protein